MLDIVCAGKDVEGTYKVVKHLLDNVGTMYDFRKSGLYKHMKFRDIDKAILDGVKEKLLEGFRNKEKFGYMVSYQNYLTQEVPIREAVHRLRMVSPDSQMVQAARAVEISFGD